MQETQKILEESVVLERAQRFSDALRHIQEARRREPQSRALAVRHAQILEATKQFPVALQLYRQLADSQPQKTEAAVLIGLGRCLVRTGHYDQAAALFMQLMEKLPEDPDVLTGLAACRRQKGALVEAEELVRKALAKHADFKPAVHELAEIHLANRDFDEALKALEQNIFREDLYGDSIDLWLKTLREQKRERYIQEHLEKLVERYPNKVEFVFALGVQAHRAGEVTVARKAFEEADRLSPNNYRILQEWGTLERMAGDIARSQELLRRALDLNPELPSALRTYGSEHKYQYGDPEFTRLNYAAARLADVAPLDQIQLHYALAKAFEDVNELDTAFRHYEIAGAKKLRLEPYNEQAASRLFQLLPQVVNARAKAVAPQKGCESEIPVFVLGMPRSGTSLLEQILASHPDIYGAGELKYLGPALDNIQFGQNRLNLSEPEPFFPYEQNASWELRGQRYVDKLIRLAGKPYKRIVDKMPGNFTMVGLITAILPKARIIHTRRHPVETCLSNYRIHYAEGQLWSYNLRTLGRYYKRYWELMKHWRKEFPEAMLEVRYEDVVMDFENQARRVIEYLGLEWQDSCLSFYETERPVKTASLTQVRKPIYTSSINRWRKYEKYLTPLLEELGDIVDEYESEIAHWLKQGSSEP